MPTPSVPSFIDPAHAWAAPIALPSGTTAIVYCEGQFGEQDGKTANGLVRHSEKYEILSVIDSTHVGADAGMLLDGHVNDIPILDGLPTAIDEIELRTGLPATDPLTRPLAELVDMVLQAFPMLSPRRTSRSAA